MSKRRKNPLKKIVDSLQAENADLRAKLALAQSGIDLLDNVATAVLDRITDDVERMAREAADEAVDDLQISR